MGDEEYGGIVYILKNEAMPGYVKIGRAANLKESRAQTPSATNLKGIMLHG